jgi:hypothetical protein
MSKKLDSGVNPRLSSAITALRAYIDFSFWMEGLSDTPSREYFPVGGLPGRGIHKEVTSQHFRLKNFPEIQS